MSPDEEALVNASPTFADLCDQLRRARIAMIAGENEVERLEDALKAAKLWLIELSKADDRAREDLDDFIDRECAVE